MCTVSWLDQPFGYEIFFNRDERRTRAQAHAPSIREISGVRFIAPTDGDFGGTWIAANEFGVSVCLVNLYGASGPIRDRATTSRGILVMSLATCGSLDDIRQRLRDADISRFEPFELLAFESGARPLLARWTGRCLSFESATNSCRPLVSSGFEVDAVTETRRATFNRLIAETVEPTAQTFDAFHASHEPERGPFSVCMHRDDARTVSYSHVAVDLDRISFRYVDGPPCESARTHQLGIDRTRRSTRPRVR